MIPKRIILVQHGRLAVNDAPTVYSRVPDCKIELVEQWYEQTQRTGGVG